MNAEWRMEFFVRGKNLDMFPLHKERIAEDNY